MNSFKKKIGDLLGFIVILLFKNKGLKKFDKHVLSIYFHNPSPFLFKGIVRFLRRNNFRFISESEMLIMKRTRLEIDERMVFISFDDGWKGNLKLLPTIEKYQIPITIFVPVKPVVTGNFWWEYAPFIIKEFDEITSVEDLKVMRNSQRVAYVNKAVAKHDLKRSAIDLSDLQLLHKHPLITIGSHTYHHPISIKCTEEELAFEYSDSKKTLEAWLNTEIKSFAYPNGDYDERDLELLSENNYQIAFTTNPALETDDLGIYEVPRVSINTKGGKYENISRMLGLWHQYVQPVQQRFKSDRKNISVQVIDQYS